MGSGVRFWRWWLVATRVPRGIRWPAPRHGSKEGSAVCVEDSDEACSQTVVVRVALTVLIVMVVFVGVFTFSLIVPICPLAPLITAFLISLLWAGARGRAARVREGVVLRGACLLENAVNQFEEKRGAGLAQRCDKVSPAGSEGC